MRSGQISKRSRGRGRKPGVQVNRSFDSNGPDVKIRGSASQIYEKYQALARDAQASGDRIMAENYLQHAEHYYRVLTALQQQHQQNQAQSSGQFQEGHRGNGRGNGTAPSPGEAPQGEAASEDEAKPEEKPSEAGEERTGDQPPRARARRRSPRAKAEPADAAAESSGGEEAEGAVASS